jgi:hypothetical protein
MFSVFLILLSYSCSIYEERCDEKREIESYVTVTQSKSCRSKVLDLI